MTRVFEIGHRLDQLGVTPPYLLFVGNPKPHKNLDNVVRAYARSREVHGVEARLVCVGDRDGAEQKVRQRAAQMGISDHVQLLGHVDQEVLPALYQGAELFLYPTLYEGFGLPVVEAMASGTAVITSNTSALKEIAAKLGIGLVYKTSFDKANRTSASCRGFSRGSTRTSRGLSNPIV